MNDERTIQEKQPLTIAPLLRFPPFRRRWNSLLLRCVPSLLLVFGDEIVQLLLQFSTAFSEILF